MSTVFKTLAIFCAVAGFVWISAGPACGQDTHYWGDQFGARSMLLSGAVIGSVSDMSAVFYNPGALGYLENPELVLSANAFQLQQIRVEDGAGEGVDLGATKFNPIPNLFAGAFRFNFYGRNKLAYSILARSRFDAKLQGSRTGEFDVDPDLPGDEIFAGGLLSSVKVSDVWVGLTWARAVREHIGFGVTTFASFRSQENWDELIAQAQAQTGETAIVYGLNNFDATMYSLLWKAGLGFDFKPITAGITLTTPNVRLAGTGSTTINETTIGVDLDGDGNPDDGFTTNIQNDVKSTYRSPLSVGVGAAWHFKKSRFHVAAEWFDGVDTYDVLELTPFVSQTTGETITRTLQQKLDSVTNYGIGYERQFSKSYTGFLGFNTDRSAYNPESQVSVTTYDIFHVSGGGKLTLEKARFTLGLRYAWGDQTARQVIDLNPDNDNDVLEDGEDVTLTFRQLTILIGFSLNI